MKITMESTDQVTHLDGVPVRVWNGQTGAGTEVVVFVHRLAVPEWADNSPFERELQECLPPGRVVDLRNVL